MKDFNYKLARIASGVARRIPSTRPLAKLACNILMCGKKRSVNIDVATAYKSLHEVHNDVHTSAVCDNHISEPTYDLQIVMPVYNVEKQLEGCIKSVLNQKTQYKFLLVIINDGSPDHSDNIIKKYESDERIKVIRQENKGFSGARNAGLREIKGRYVMFVDSDDALADNAIESLMSMAYEDDADIVEGNYYSVTQTGKRLVHKHMNEHLVESHKLMGFACMKIYKAEMFCHLHFPEKYWFEDTLNAFILFPMAKRVSLIENPVYEYLINTNGISATCKGKTKSLDTLYITEALLKDGTELGLIDTTKQQLYEHMFHQIIINFSRTGLLGEEVRQSVFVVSCELMEKYFSGCHTQIASNKAFEKAIRERNYKAYTICCLMHS